MIPKEKAEVMFFKNMRVQENYDIKSNIAKQSALIAVTEIIDALSNYDKYTEQHLKDEFGVEYYPCELQNMDNDFRYWSKVKQEIEKL